MKTWKIKGLCEYCGFAYKGTISNSKEVYFPIIKCPNCHTESQNFDEAYAVDALNKVEGTVLDYKESVFEIVSEEH